MLCKCCVALSAYMCHSCATSRRTVRYDTCYATAVLRYQYICIIVARQQVGQYGMIHVMQMLCCLRTDRLEENGNGVPGLELPAPELKNLAQIAKVATAVNTAAVTASYYLLASLRRKHSWTTVNTAAVAASYCLLACLERVHGRSIAAVTFVAANSLIMSDSSPKQVSRMHIVLHTW